jgi:hypothetical protein
MLLMLTKIDEVDDFIIDIWLIKENDTDVCLKITIQ